MGEELKSNEGENFKMPETKPKNESEKHLDQIKNRSMEYVNRGDLKNAIDSMVFGICGDPEISSQEKTAVGMLGIYMKDKKNLTKENVIDWINAIEL